MTVTRPTTAPTSAPPLGGGRWNPYDQDTVDARAFVSATVLLLQGVLQAGPTIEPALLVEQLRATLSRDTRESSFPIRPGSGRAAAELASQADRIGPTLVGWVADDLRTVLSHPRALPAGPLVVRSHCDGHLLTRHAAQTLLGPPGGPVAMQLYNEFLHQLVLLRDAMLPFTNWADVPFPVDARGLRRTEESRMAFLAEAAYRQVRHSSIVRYARHLLTGSDGPAGYAFTYPSGSALPAALSGALLTCPAHLLSWSSQRSTSHVTTWACTAADYDATPRADLASLAEASATTRRTVDVHLVVRDRDAGSATASLRLAEGPGTAEVEVDLGQALRGHRYAARTDGPTDAGVGQQLDTAPPGTPVPPWPLLAMDALARADAGLWVVPVAGLPHLVQLAVLGRLYPRHVLLQSPSNHLDRGHLNQATVVVQVAE